MFPHPQDLISAGCKVQRDADLTIVAQTITRSPYPKSVVLRTEVELRDACHKRLVIKRDYSDSTSCTFLPAKAYEEAVIKEDRETRRLYSGIRRIPRPVWMGQPFNQHLADKGELRAFVVNKQLRYTVNTSLQSSGLFHIEFADNYTPLDRLE